MEKHGYESEIASLKLINKNGTEIFLRRASHSDGYGTFYVMKDESELIKFCKENHIELDSFDMRIGNDWKATTYDCYNHYENDGVELVGEFIQVFRKYDTFFFTLN